MISRAVVALFGLNVLVANTSAQHGGRQLYTSYTTTTSEEQVQEASVGDLVTLALEPSNSAEITFDGDEDIDWMSVSFQQCSEFEPQPVIVEIVDSTQISDGYAYTSNGSCATFQSGKTTPNCTFDWHDTNFNAFSSDEVPLPSEAVVQVTNNGEETAYIDLAMFTSKLTPPIGLVDAVGYRDVWFNYAEGELTTDAQFYGEVPYCQRFDCYLTGYLHPFNDNQTYLNACQVTTQEGEMLYNVSYDGSSYWTRSVALEEGEQHLYSIVLTAMKKETARTTIFGADQFLLAQHQYGLATRLWPTNLAVITVGTTLMLTSLSEIFGLLPSLF